MSDLSYLSRGTAKNIATFTAREIAARVGTGLNNIDVDDYTVFAHKWDIGICIVCICNKNYPNRVAFALLQHIFFIFIEKHPDGGINYSQDINLNIHEVKTLVTKYRDPSSVDAYQNLSGKIENTIKVVHQTVNDLLHNEETLEALVNQSKDLSTRTKDVFSKSKKLRRKSCCALM